MDDDENIQTRPDSEEDDPASEQSARIARVSAGLIKLAKDPE